MAQFIWPLTPVSVVGGATELTALDQLAELEQINTNTAGLSDVSTATKQDEQTTILTDIETNTGTSASAVAVTGGAPPATAMRVGMDDAGQLSALTSDGSGNLRVSVQNSVTEATLTNIDNNISNINGLTQNINDNTANTVDRLDSIKNATVTAQIDSTPLLDTSITNIPASASNPLELVASLPNDITSLVSVEDIGEFLGIYTGAAASEVLLGVLPLGGGELKVFIAAGTRISIRNMKNAVVDSGSIAINFIGNP